MKRSLRAAAAGIGAVAVLAATAGVASAATPPWQSPATDPNNIGTLSFFDASGNQIISGSTLSTIPYIQATTGALTGSLQKATLFAYTPNPGLPPGAWSGASLSVAYAFPNASAPGSLATDPRPLAHQTAADTTLDDYSNNSFPQTSTTAGYQNTYELRVKLSGGVNYASADITIDQATQTWTQVFPVINTVGTTTTLTATPAGPQTIGATPNITVAANVAANSGSTTPSGTVSFFSDGVQVGTTQTVDGSGNAHVVVTPNDLGTGTHALTAAFTPANPLSFSASTSSASSYKILGQVIATTTAVAQSGASTDAYSQQTLTATVTPASGTTVPAGTVTFVDSINGNLGSAPVTGGTAPGTATLQTNALGAGDHVVTATYTPTDPTAFSGSNGATPTFTLNAVGATPDPQTIKVTIAPGSLTISTPYTAANPFDLGTAVLSTDGTQLTASGAFGDATHPANGVTITDTRAGDQQWTASASASDFTIPPATSGTLNVTEIDSTYLSFTGVTPSYIAGNALNATTKPVVGHDVAAPALGVAPDATHPGLKGAPHAFATAVHGDGSVYVYGTLGLTIPTSVQAGTYTGVVTFTLA